jgi:hypothetical protein
MNDKKFQRKLKNMKKLGEQYRQEAEIREEYAKYVPERKKRKVSNIMLVISVIAILAYTSANFLLTYISGISIDPTLTTCYYTFWGSELIALATMKTSKIIKESHSASVAEDTVNYEDYNAMG